MSGFDVIVVGGGPAGAATAALLAQFGRRVLVLEREEFPRYQVGESLMPATYWTLQRLGVLEKLQSSHFVRKGSVQFFSKDGKASLPFYFSEVDPHESSTTWQVVRSEFDQLLLDNAEEKGAEVWQRVSVTDVLFEGEQAVGVRATNSDGSRRDLGAPVVVDASGQNALLSRKLNLKKSDPQLKHAAFFTRFRSAARESGIDEGATLIMHTREGDSWFWYIPLPNDVVSVGVVGHIDYLLKGRVSNPQRVFDEELEKCEALKPRLRKATQEVNVQVLRDFSYSSRSIAGDGWVLVGDAFGFLDPIYSSGIFFALKSAEFAADSINQAFEKNDFSAAQLGRHGSEFVEGMESMRRLIYAYYDKEFSFASFLKKFPKCRENLVNLLIGNVFRKPCTGLFEPMNRYSRLSDYEPLGLTVEKA